MLAAHGTRVLQDIGVTRQLRSGKLGAPGWRWAPVGERPRACPSPSAGDPGDTYGVVFWETVQSP